MLGYGILLSMKFRHRTWLFVFPIFCLASLAGVQCAGAVEVAPVAEKFCELQDERINESSGLAASRKYAAQELLVTHNDSGGEPEVFYVDPQGRTVADMTLKGATNVDWEDIAIAGDFIYAADIGDNARVHPQVTVYRLREPELEPEKGGQKLEAECEKMTLTYPEGPCDAETLMATPSGELIIVSKNGGPSRFYKTPRPFENGTAQVMEKFGEYSFTGKSPFSFLTTGGDISADGSRFVVRTYTHAYEWMLGPDGDWKAALAAAPRIWELPVAKQGEAICYSADGMEYFVSSEGVPAPIWRIEFSPVG